MKKVHFVLSSLCLCASVVSSFAGDWPQFRGPGGTAVSSETDLPTTWSGTEGLRWKVDLPGRGVSNPVIAKGKVYVTASSRPEQDRLHVLCFDAATGKQLWERQFRATGPTMCHEKTTMAGPTPVTDGERVYALFGCGDLVCLDSAGDLIWYRSLYRDRPAISNQLGLAASPILFKDTLLVPLENAGDSFAAGLDKMTGLTKWTAERMRDINWVTPALLENSGRTDAVFVSGKEVTAYDPETGKKRWSYSAGGFGTIPSPTVAGKETLLVPGKDLLLLKAVTDKGEPEVGWKTTKLNSGYCTPVVFEGRVYNTTANTLVCASLEDGKVLWTERVEGPFSASPVIANGMAYLANEKGVVTVVRLSEKPEVVATNDVGEPLLATPAVADGAIFLRSDKHLFCVGKKK